MPQAKRSTRFVFACVPLRACTEGLRAPLSSRKNKIFKAADRRKDILDLRDLGVFAKVTLVIRPTDRPY